MKCVKYIVGVSVLTLSVVQEGFGWSPWGFSTREERLQNLINIQPSWDKVKKEVARDGGKLEIIDQSDLKEVFNTRLKNFQERGRGRNLAPQDREMFAKQAELAVANEMTGKHNAIMRRYAKNKGLHFPQQGGYVVAWWKDGVRTLESFIDTSLVRALDAFDADNNGDGRKEYEVFLGEEPVIPGGHNNPR